MMPSESQRVFFSSERAATPHCFEFANRSLLAAEVQINRVWSPRAAPPEYSGDLQHFDLILIDLHFFFVALRNLYRYFEKIVLDPAYAHLIPDLERLNNNWFKHYSPGREAFEHINQRLPGERHESKIAEIQENGTRRKVHYGLDMNTGVFSHSDLEWDIRLETFEQLKRDADSFLDSVVQASNNSLKRTP